MAKKWSGVYCVTCTAFTDGDEVDEQAQRRHIRFLLDEGGVHGIICTGSTGEFAALSESERRKVVEVVLDEVGGKVPVLVGAAAVSTQDAIRYARHAESSGADGIMVVPPYYCHPTERELYEHYRALAASIRLPIMLYNNPWTSGVDMLPPLVARLAEIDNITHIKESSGDMRRVSEIMRLSGDRMTVLCGADNLALEMLMLGVRGWVAAPANAIPKQCVDLYDLVVVERNLEKARELYFKVLPFFAALEAGQFVQFAKASLDILGRGIGQPRRPLLPAAAQDREMLERLLHDILA